MKPANLIDLARSRDAAEVVLAKLVSDKKAESLQAGQEIIQSSRELGISARDYLRLAVDPSKGEMKNSELDGYETALAYLSLPVQDDFSKGVVLQAAAETFQTFPGVRALFPEVVDDIVQWKYRQEQLESVDGIVSQSRTVAGVEMITTVIDDKADDYQQYGVIAEGARIPVRSIRATEHAVKFYKFGGGYEFTYEFNRRASLDLIAPYAARMQREVAIGQVAIATSMLINGDAVNGAATVTDADTLATAVGGTHTAGKIEWDILLKWLMERAKAGTPVDTVVGNWDMHFQWLKMFAAPSIGQGIPQIEVLRQAGVNLAEANPRFRFNVNFQVSSTAPASKLIGFSKADTLEELVETGSDIEESQRAIENQKVKYVRTKNNGYRLIFGDTRDILDLS